uniref:Terpene synthase n=1 Tax=Stellera chamaejasme TaxID=142738 RepID=A0A6G9KN63_9ROSI|nr:terpene synthase [Stellera chamaejasme]
MDSSRLLMIESVVEEIKKEMGGMDMQPYSFVNPSAYDTAWLAMIPDPGRPGQPAFRGCLDWVVRNQMDGGFWGGSDGHGLPTIESLTATLACLVALTKWNTGKDNIQRGLAFLEANTEKLLVGMNNGSYPRWFAIVFPGMIELARKIGLNLPAAFSDHLLIDVFNTRRQILETEELVGDHCPPLLSYLEALPSCYFIGNRNSTIIRNEVAKAGGASYQSPSATAQAFILTGDDKCLRFLQDLVQTCPNGVPQTYPMDEALIKLCVVNQIQKLGVGQHFSREIEGILSQVYRCGINGDDQLEGKSRSMLQLCAQLHKDALAFRLLRMHGYNVSPRRLCWFLRDGGIREVMEKNHEQVAGVMLEVHRAAEVMFPGEVELNEAMSFSRRLLLKLKPTQSHMISMPFATLIEHEINLHWAARMDHLEHRMWIEEKDMNALWMGKLSFHRLSNVMNRKLMHLAILDYEFRQSIYKNELEELNRWSCKWGLKNIGFGREKTTYCYFAISSCFPLGYHHSDVRLLATKSAILITVADDYFDEQASLHDLTLLTQSIQRWNGKSLSGHGATIFNALDNFVKETCELYLQKQGIDITSHIRKIWCETFESWLVEAKWSKNGNNIIPSTEEYLRNGMTSIATHTVVLPSSCLLDPTCLPMISSFKPSQYQALTKLAMVIPRLLNDIQSYRKEQDQGKLNYVLLYLKENPEAEIEDSIAHIRNILESKRQELLQHVLLDNYNELMSTDDRHHFPKPCKQLHLACVKVFQMFFNTRNRYDDDSDTEMLQDIQNALYIPLNVGKTPRISPSHHPITHDLKDLQEVISSKLRFRPSLMSNGETKTAAALNITNHHHASSAMKLYKPIKYGCSRNMVRASHFMF